jgi:hypothetical protein
MADSIPYLSFPASGSPLGTSLDAHTARSLYPGADKGARTYPSVSTGRRNGGPVALKQNIPHIPYAWHLVSSRIMVMIASGPVTSTTQ